MKRPKHWNAGATDTRFADVTPASYNKADRTVEAVLSLGSPVQRFYGTEVLRIDPGSVILERMKNGGIPLLDSHQQAGISNALGRVTKAWFNRGALMGTLSFNKTPEGEKAEGMVARGEIAGVSAGYTVREWEIADAAGVVVDPDNFRFNMDDDMTFTATRWELLECSLVAVPADMGAGIRSIGSGVDRVLPQVEMLRCGAIRITKRFGDASITYEYPTDAKIHASDGADVNDIKARMQARQAMFERMNR